MKRVALHANLITQMPPANRGTACTDCYIYNTVLPMADSIANLLGRWVAAIWGIWPVVRTRRVERHGWSPAHGHRVWGFRVVLSVTGRERLSVIFRKIGGGSFLFRACDHTRVRQRCSDAGEIVHPANRVGRIPRRGCDAS